MSKTNDYEYDYDKKNETTTSMDINCTVRGRFISQGKEILTHHFLLCIVRTTELQMLSTSLAADPDCKGNSERMPSEVLSLNRGSFNTTQ